MAAHNQICTTYASTRFYAQYFYLFTRKVLALCSHLVAHLKTMSRWEPFSIRRLLSCAFRSTASLRAQSLRILYQYLIFMYIFVYHASDRRADWEENVEAPLKRVWDEATFFSPGLEHSFTAATKLPPIPYPSLWVRATHVCRDYTVCRRIITRLQSD